MQRYEYRVIPAPQRGEKARGAKTTPDRFALALTGLMNRMGEEGWDYLRADTLPCEERVGLTGRATTFQNMLVFRRVRQGEAMAPDVEPVTTDIAPEPLPSPARRLGAAEVPLGHAPAIGPATVLDETAAQQPAPARSGLAGG